MHTAQRSLCDLTRRSTFVTIRTTACISERRYVLQSKGESYLSHQLGHRPLVSARRDPRCDRLTITSVAEFLHTSFFVHSIYQWTIIGPAEALRSGSTTILESIPLGVQAALVIGALIIVTVQASTHSHFRRSYSHHYRRDFSA